jgi:hypothetical protein
MEIAKPARHRPRAEHVSRILEAGTAPCRLYGLSKTSVADIARLLGKSRPACTESSLQGFDMGRHRRRFPGDHPARSPACH